jgi:hypothetical protein
MIGRPGGPGGKFFGRWLATAYLTRVTDRRRKIPPSANPTEFIVETIPSQEVMVA